MKGNGKTGPWPYPLWCGLSSAPKSRLGAPDAPQADHPWRRRCRPSRRAPCHRCIDDCSCVRSTFPGAIAGLLMRGGATGAAGRRDPTTATDRGSKPRRRHPVAGRALPRLRPRPRRWHCRSRPIISAPWAASGRTAGLSRLPEVRRL
jgi:hypothetical protein